MCNSGIYAFFPYVCLQLVPFAQNFSHILRRLTGCSRITFWLQNSGGQCCIMPFKICLIAEKPLSQCIYVLDHLIRSSQQADMTEYISPHAHLLICSSRCAAVKKPVLSIRTDLSGGCDLRGPRKEDPSTFGSPASAPHDVDWPTHALEVLGKGCRASTFYSMLLKSSEKGPPILKTAWETDLSVLYRLSVGQNYVKYYKK